VTSSFNTVQKNTQTLQELNHKLYIHMKNYGYQLIEIPIIERANLFLTKAGDRIAERLLTLEHNDTTLALRPEFTASAAHEYITQGFENPMRWQFNGPIFFQDVHQHQQHSIGAELIGLSGPMPEAEVMVMAVQGIIELGITDWTLVIGHVGLMRQLLAQFNLDQRTQHFILNNREVIHSQPDLLNSYLNGVTPMFRGVSALSQDDTQELLDILLNTSRANMTMGGRTRHDIARRLLRKRQQIAQQEQIIGAITFLEKWSSIRAPIAQAMAQIAPFVESDPVTHEIYQHWQNVVNLVQSAGLDADKIIIQPDLARTWDYYTGSVFELYANQTIQIAGGGRYDELPRLIGSDRDIPAVGFAYYADNILSVLPEQSAEQIKLYHLVINEQSQSDGMRWGAILRQHQISVIVVEQDNAHPNDLTLSPDGELIYQGIAYPFDSASTLIKVLQNV
jgi:histidyl-tRNA synthetase